MRTCLRAKQSIAKSCPFRSAFVLPFYRRRSRWGRPSLSGSGAGSALPSRSRSSPSNSSCRPGIDSLATISFSIHIDRRERKPVSVAFGCPEPAGQCGSPENSGISSGNEGVGGPNPLRVGYITRETQEAFPRALQKAGSI